VSRKQEVDLCLPREGIRLGSRAELKEWSVSLCLHILPRVPMGWGSSLPGDSTKEALNFPLEVTNALAAWCPILVAGKMERDWDFGWTVFWIGDRSHGWEAVGMAEGSWS
jgi:hypothetical protein